MRKTFFTLLMILMNISLMATPKILRSSDMAELELKALSEDLMQYDVIFFGEHHGNAILHELQKDILPGLHTANRDLILSFEMWERDTQGVLDAFLAAKIPEDEFILDSRAWPNYEDYRPLLIFAREHGLNAIAANIPRQYASRTAREGWDFVQKLPDEEREFIAAKLTAPDDSYKKEFMQVMGKMGAHGMQKEAMENLYKAQCIKDDTMAESIVLALMEKPQARVIHFNGDFHSRSFLGTVSRLIDSMPQLKVAVLTPQLIAEGENLPLPEEAKTLGTHLILIPADTREASR